MRYWMMVVGGLFSAALATAQTPCAVVVDATVAEMATAMGAEWQPALEQTVRTAAASACVKAMSGRYAAAEGDSASTDAPDGASTVSEAQTVSTTPVSESVEPAADSGGFTFKPLSGSPTRKPYARKRRTGTDDNTDSDEAGY